MEPLPARLRPTRLEDLEGQEHLLGPIRRLLTASTLPAVVLVGPPGTGKTTLAQLLAAAAGWELVAIDATVSGAPVLRDAIATHRGGVLFVDEIHRLTRPQQDVLLAALEAGSIGLIGATTENPSVLSAALRSRVDVWRLRALAPDALERILARAVPAVGVAVEPAALAVIAAAANGDARLALRVLDTAAHTVRDHGSDLLDTVTAADAAGVIAARHASESDMISALIKSIRGSDADAAAYWTMRLLDAGSDPLYLARRLVIAASEDIGLVDDNALPLAVAALHATEKIGMPEATYPLVHVATRLALANKSNLVARTIDAARSAVASSPHAGVPPQVSAAATGYRYPHDTTPDPVIAQRHAPHTAHGVFDPRSVGPEEKLASRWDKLRRLLGR